jgi:signal transduction histidine kinase
VDARLQEARRQLEQLQREGAPLSATTALQSLLVQIESRWVGARAEALHAELAHAMIDSINDIYLQVQMVLRDLAHADVDSRDPSARRLDEVVEEIGRLTAKVDQLRVPHARAGESVSLDITSLLDEVVEHYARHSRGPLVELHTDFASVPAVSGDDGALQRALRNVLDLSTTTMPSDGRLQLTLRPTDDAVEVVFEHPPPDAPSTVALDADARLQAARDVVHAHGGTLTTCGGDDSPIRHIVRLPPAPE